MKRIMFVSLAIIDLSLLAAGCQAAAQDTSQKGSPTSSATLPAAVPEGVDPNSKPFPAPAEVPVSSSHAFTDLTFSKDYNAGTKDANGRFIGGT